jgi:pimeloyl-[acyl-carrier protein] methyl ester esterase
LRADTFNEFRPQVRALTEGLDVLEHSDLRARLPQLTQASAWIAGRRDRLIPWQAMQWSAAQCGGVFTCIAGGGHAPFIGHTNAVVAALAPLLAGVAT